MKKRVEVPFKIISTENLLVTSGIHEWSGVLLNFRPITEHKLREINILPKGDEFEAGEQQRLPEHTSNEEKYYIEALVNTCKTSASYEEKMMELLNEDRHLFEQTSQIVDLAINTIISALEASGHIEDETYGEKQGKKATGECIDAYNEIKKRGYKLLSLTDDDGINPSYNETANFLYDYFCQIYSNNLNKVPTIKNIEKRLKNEVPITHNPKKGNRSDAYVDFFTRINYKIK